MRSTIAFKDGKYELARAEIEETAPAPLAILTGGLLTAWSEQAAGKVDDALKTIEELSGPSWYGIFQDYHQALIADLAGRKDEAVERITEAFNADGSALRVVEAYGIILARAGKRQDAIVGLRAFVAEQPNNPVIGALLAAARSGRDAAAGGHDPGRRCGRGAVRPRRRHRHRPGHRAAGRLSASVALSQARRRPHADGARRPPVRRRAVRGRARTSTT